MISFRVALVPALYTLIALSACGKKEETTQTTTSVSTTASSTVVPQTPAPAPAPATTSSAPPAAPAATAGSIATSEGETPGLRVDVTELKRSSGGTVSLKFAFVNGTAKDFSISNHYLGDSHVASDTYRGVSGVHLVDPVNKKKYFVIVDAEMKCLCSKDVPEVPAGGKVNLWAKFPAPPADVQKVTIEIPHFAPMDDVTIQ
ncbi:MAG: hypothetical protein ACXVJT_18545 [Thermoanaerobaculia bacterium]